MRQHCIWNYPDLHVSYMVHVYTTVIGQWCHCLTTYTHIYILVKVPCEFITGKIARGRGREPIKHEAQLSALFARDHAPSAIFPVMHE